MANKCFVETNFYFIPIIRTLYSGYFFQAKMWFLELLVVQINFISHPVLPNYIRTVLGAWFLNDIQTLLLLEAILIRYYSSYSLTAEYTFYQITQH